MKAFRNGRKKLTASVTVEASLIIPMVVLTVIAIIVLCFYWYDRISVRSEITIIAEQFRQNMEEGEIPEKAVTESLRDYPLARKCLATINVKDSILRVRSILALRAELELKLPSRGLLAMLTRNIRSILVQQQYEVTDREQFQRCLDILLEKIEGG